MSRLLKRMSALVCVATLLFGLMPGNFVLADTKQELDNAKDKEKELANKLESVKGTIKQLQSDIADTEKYVEKLDDELAGIANDINELNEKIDAKNDDIAITADELIKAQETEQAQYEAMKQRIKYMYENNNMTYMDSLIAGESYSDKLNKAEYASKVTAYDRDKLDEYIEIKEYVAQTKAQLESEEEALQEYKQEMEVYQESVQVIYDAKNEEMEKLEADKTAYLKKQKEIEQSQKELDELITKLVNQYNAEQLAKANAVATQGNLFGKQLLIWPCPSSRVISSGFSPNRLDPVTGRYYSPHKGTDIAASTGTPVVAAASGLVTAAGYSSSMGNYVVISHGDGITTRYYHNSSLAVSAGQAVTAGQTISYVGSTGWSTGPHLHFEVRINDVPYDPMQFFN